MKKISRLMLTNLHNREHYQFHSDFINLMNEAFASSSSMSKVSTLFSAYHALFLDEDKAYKEIVKSENTEKIQAADKERDNLFGGMVDANNLALRHYRQEIKDAANRLKIIFDTYGNLAIKTLKGETADIKNLIQELRTTKHNDDVTKVGLAGWITELEVKNNLCEQLMKDRVDEKYEKGSLVMRDCRLKVDDAYRAIIVRIEALTEIEGEDQYAMFIDKLNIVIEEYKTIINHRK